jgi:phosphatidylinositol alpha 1,6-mannosyltransferase
LRIALVNTAYSHIEDGSILTLRRLVDYLEARGDEVMVFSAAATSSLAASPGTLVAVPSIPVPGRSDYRLALGLSRHARRRLREFAPRVVHIAAPDLLGRRAASTARRLGLPVVASYHARWDVYLGYYGLGWLRGALRVYLRSFFNACEAVYVPLPSVRDVLVEQGVTADIRLWGRGVDTMRFNPAHRSEPWRQGLGIAPDELVIGFVSRLVREKGLDILAAVLDGLTRRGIAHRAVIVGDGPERKSLQRRVSDAVFTGLVGGDELARAYASLDIFLFPSDSETFGNVTLEAMASGLPAVCADAPGSRSLVEPGVTGFLAEPRQPGAFIRHIAMLASDAELRRRMGTAARERALGFSWDVEMARIFNYYRDVARGSRQPVWATGDDGGETVDHRARG